MVVHLQLVVIPYQEEIQSPVGTTLFREVTRFPVGMIPFREIRLNETIDTLTIEHENTIASESVIRDADMAKEMTNFIKDNILAQAAQSMLAQANQNGSAVLSLLQ